MEYVLMDCLNYSPALGKLVSVRDSSDIDTYAKRERQVPTNTFGKF